MGRKVNGGLTSGIKGQTSLENYDLLNVLNSQAAAGDISYMRKNEQFNKNISKRIDVDPNGVFDVIAHGDPKNIQINVNGRQHEVSWRVLANSIKKNPELKGKTIRLLSCYTGATDNSFAQNLANKLNVPVIAPTKYLWANPNGTHYVAGGRINPKGKLEPIVSDLGEFKTFYPKRRKK